MEDIPAHILDAVHTGAPPKHMNSGRRPRKSPRSTTFSQFLRDSNSSADDVSTTSYSDCENEYQTDFTTPASSDMSPEDMQPDDVEDFRDREYPQLKGKTYLDHGGTTLYAKSLVEQFSADLISNLYGNPHSASTPSAISGHRIDIIRERALRFFNADPEEFDLIFVANATAAIKLVIDCFKDHASASNTPVWYGYHRDAHTSLVGVRESTKLHRCFTSDEEVDIWINSGGLGGPRARQLGLFAYPGQSNMTGRRLPLSWPGRIRKSFHKAPTYTLLDAAALASTAPLDLSDPATAPDFVALSFYKIFGFPNIGALIVRKDSAHVLESRKFFGGGTVEMVISINDTWHAKKDTSLHDRLEDGTLPFHSIFALDHAMNVHRRLYGPNPMKFISFHTAQLGKQLFDGISALKHHNGTPVCRIYKDDAAVYGDPTMQGATIAFNVQNADGSLVGFEDVEEAADDRNIFVRSGSLCNPGGVATYLGWSPAEMKAAFASGHRCSNPTQTMLGKSTGVVRVSLGAMSIAADVQTLLHFLEDVYIKPAAVVDPPRDSSVAYSASLPFRENSLPEPASASSSAFAKLPSLHIPPHSYLMSASPSPCLGPPTASPAHSDPSSKPWTTDSDLSALPLRPPAPYSSHSATDPDQIVRPKNPPFVPTDYTAHRKPWKEEMRKQAALQDMEIEVRELEAASVLSHGRAPTPSVKARRFGRSVVNLLRNGNGKPPMPASPVPPDSAPNYQYR